MAKDISVDKIVFQEQLGLSAIDSIEAIDFIKDSIFTGYARSHIQNELKTTYHLDDRSITKLIDSAYQFIETFSLDQLDLQTIVDVHISNYEKVYEFFDSVNFYAGKVKTLQQKERLLGFHQQLNTLTINQFTNIETPNNDEDYSRLKPEEELRLRFLLKKASI